jgi:ferredoxin
MAYIIAEPCIGTKDTACVDVCPVDCIHPAKGRTYDDGRPAFDKVPQLYIDPGEYIEINKNYVDGGKFQPNKYQKASS